MTVSVETKLRWFEQGASAFAQTFPAKVAEFPAGGPFYVCPLCIRPDARAGTSKAFLFPRAAVEGGILTAEHVPPESFGGKELLLTCARNHTAGAHLDSHARTSTAAASAKPRPLESDRPSCRASQKPRATASARRLSSPFHRGSPSGCRAPAHTRRRTWVGPAARRDVRHAPAHSA